MDKILHLITNIEVELEKIEESRKMHLLEALDKFRAEVVQASIDYTDDEDDNSSDNAI